MNMQNRCIVAASAGLHGAINIPSSKNASMPIIALSCLLKNSRIRIRNLPKITDIDVLLHIFEYLGVTFSWQGNDVILSTPDKALQFDIPDRLSSSLRGSIYCLPMILSSMGHAKIGRIGGDVIKGRSLTPHINALRGFGIQLNVSNDGLELVGRPKRNSEFSIDDHGITATSLAIMLALTQESESIIHNASPEIEVNDVIKIANQYGAKIYRDQSTLIVQGTLQSGDYTIDLPPDQVVWGTYAIASLITEGNIVTTAVDSNQISNRYAPIYEALTEAGALITSTDKGIAISGNIERPINIETGTYPKFPSDLVPQMMVLMSQLKGESTVVENLYQQRYDHASQLEKMGVCLNVNGNTAIIHGSKKPLTGTQVECAGIRESCALILAGLIAEPSTEVNNAAAVNRGYADIVSDLTNLGANIYWG